MEDGESDKKFTADVGSKKVDTFGGTVYNIGSCENKNEENRGASRIRIEQKFELEPFTKGGSHSVDNLRLLCARHSKCIEKNMVPLG